MKVCLLTLYSYRPEQVRQIYNPFSYVQHLFDSADNIFFNTGMGYIKKDFDGLTVPTYKIINNGCNIEEWKDKLSKYDKIFCSIHFPPEISIIKPLIDKRWVIGGPIIEIFDYDWGSLPCTVFNGLLEDYLKAPVSTIFTDYFTDYFANFCDNGITTQNSFTISLDKLCYWGKCKFCLENNNKINVYRGLLYDKISNIVDCTNKISGHINLSIPSITRPYLKEILESQTLLDKKNLTMFIYLRAEKQYQKMLEDSPALNRMVVFLGLEGFTNKIMDFYNKNLNIDDAIEIIRTLIQKRAPIIITMQCYPFLTKQDTEESIFNISRMVAGLEKYNPSINCYTYQTYWLSEQDAKNISYDYRNSPIMFDGELLQYSIPRYMINLSKDALFYHSKIIEYMRNIGFCITNTQIENLYKE